MTGVLCEMGLWLSREGMYTIRDELIGLDDGVDGRMSGGTTGGCTGLGFLSVKNINGTTGSSLGVIGAT